MEEGKWSITFEKPKGQRLMKRFTGVTAFGGEKPIWWSYETRKFKNWSGGIKEASSTHAPCRSYKSFKRFLRKHPELRGYDVVLCSRYIGFNVTAKWISS